MGKNYEMRRRGLISDKLDMDSLPQKMIMSRMLSRNKDELIDINKKTRSSTMTMTRLESNMNTQLMANLEGAKNLLLQILPEVRRTKEFEDALLNVSLLTRMRRNDKLTNRRAYDKAMELNQVELPTDVKYNYGSARDIVLEDEYLRISGLSRPVESISMRSVNPADDTNLEDFYAVKKTPYTNKVTKGGGGIPENSGIRDNNISLDELTPEEMEQLKEEYNNRNKKANVKQIKPTKFQLEDFLAQLRGEGNLPYEPEVSLEPEDIPEDLTQYVKDVEDYKKQIPDNSRQERIQANKLERILEKEGAGEKLAPHDIRTKKLLTATTREELFLKQDGTPIDYTETNIDLTEQAQETVKTIKKRKEKAFSRTHMETFVGERNPAFFNPAPHHGEEEIDGSGYVRIHPTNSLLYSVLNPAPQSRTRSSLTSNVSRANEYSNTMTSQDRANEQMAYLMNRATAQEMEDEGMGMD